MPASSSSSVSSNPLDLFRLDGRVAIVTGASSGLGEHFARLLHSVGARVVVAARRAERLERLCADLPGAVAIAVDLANADDRERLVAETTDRVGPPRILVNNAGIGVTVGIENEKLDDFRDVMEINVTAPWHLTKLCAPHMIAQGGGNVVNIASMLGLVGGTPVKQAGYCASKGAVLNMTRELGLQFARKGIRVNAICPGWFPSEMTGGMVDDESSMTFVRNTSPIPRMGELHELDGAMLLLTGDACSFMTGQSVVVDGGWTAR